MIVKRIAQAIEESGKSRYAISNETGIDQAVLCRIANGGSCGMKTADKLCNYLGLELRPRKAKAR
jgi:ribosome-binding protein aMBF1 (putative translation factor)